MLVGPIFHRVMRNVVVLTYLEEHLTAVRIFSDTESQLTGQWNL